MFSDWTLLLYGTEDPAQPTDQRYSSYTPSAPRSGQFITSQVGLGFKRRKTHKGSFHFSSGFASKIKPQFPFLRG